MSRRLLTYCLFALLVAAGCVRLGFWQLSRLRERRAANAAVAARLVAAPVPIAALPADADAARWRRVRVDGTLDYAHEALLGNRTHEGSPGAWLLTPLVRPGTDTVVYVNRGWVYAPDGRTVDLARWREDGVVAGSGWVEPFPTGEGPRNAAGDSVVLRRMNRDALARRAGRPVAPFVVVLQPDGGTAARPADAHPSRLPLPALDEGPHLSYAIQWFSFATIAVVGVAGLAVSERRRRAV